MREEDPLPWESALTRQVWEALATGQASPSVYLEGSDGCEVVVSSSQSGRNGLCGMTSVGQET